jgi:hypothetical protein
MKTEERGQRSGVRGQEAISGLQDRAETHEKHRMSNAQCSKYWREWGKAERAAKRHGIDLDRHAIHVQALGVDKSHFDLTNEEFDDVLAEFFAVSQPENVDLQLRQQEQAKVRLRWRISRFAPESYTRHLILTRFRAQLGGVEEPEQRGTVALLQCLGKTALRQLRDTLAARASGERRRTGRPVEQEEAEVTEDRRQRSEDGSQRSEVSVQRSAEEVMA